MAIIGFDGFDNYSAISDLARRRGGFSWVGADTGGDAQIITPGRGGFGQAVGITLLRAVLDTAKAELYTGFAMSASDAAVSAGATLRVTFQDNSIVVPGGHTSAQCFVDFNAKAGYVRIWGGPYVGGNPNFTLLATSGPNAFIPATYPMVEIHVRATHGSQQVEVRVAGITVASASGSAILAADLSSGIVDTISFGYTPDASTAISVPDGVVRPFAMIIDDFRMNDMASDGGAFPNNSWMGDLRVATLIPVGNNGTPQWTPLSGSNYQNVNDSPFNEGATYNSAATSGLIDRFNFAALPANTATIFGMQVNGMYRETDSGGRTLQQLVRVGGTDYAGTTRILNTAYEEICDLFVTNPSNGANWTLSDIDNIIAGYKAVT